MHNQQQFLQEKIAKINKEQEERDKIKIVKTDKALQTS